MNKRSISLSIWFLSSLSLSSCWVPQVIQGIRPELVKASPPATADQYQVNRNEGLTALATRMISISREAAEMMRTSRTISTRRQQVENFIYFNVKNSSGLPDWFFNGKDYTTYNATRRSNYTLSFMNSERQPYPFDVLAIANYGGAPLPAKTFPSDFSHYELSVAQTPENQVGTLKLTLRGEIPRQIPLRGNFDTVLSGQGENTDHPILGAIGLQFDARTSLDGTITEGQLSFDTVFQGQAYHGFGRLDALGFTSTVDIQQNGQSVLQIRRIDQRWEVIRDNQVVATGA
jgi:hypothetical protein